MADELFRAIAETDPRFRGLVNVYIRDEQAEREVASWRKVREATGANYATNAEELRGVAQRIHRYACNIEAEMGITAAEILFAVAAALEK